MTQWLAIVYSCNPLSDPPVIVCSAAMSAPAHLATRVRRVMRTRRPEVLAMPTKHLVSADGISQCFHSHCPARTI